MGPIKRKIIKTDKIYSIVLPYLNHGVQVDNTLYISGQLGANLKGELADGMEAQTRLSLINLGHVLNTAGGTYENVVKVTVLLADINTFPIMNKVYGEFFKTNFPARAAYQVAKLPWGGLIEIEAVAVIGEIVDIKN